MARILFIFIDGLGIPPQAVFKETTLFSKSQKDYPWSPPGDGVATAVDASLGTPGLPQSATGQTALITGVNAPAIMGRHVSGFPGSTLKAIIKRKGLFQRLQMRGISRNNLCFANAFRPPFFHQTPKRVSVSTFHALSAGLSLATLDHIAQGKALYHDFTNRFLIKQGYSVSPLSPSRAGEILARIASNHTFTFYEYFLTDLAGHKKDSAMALSILKALEEMIMTLVECLPLEETTLMVASDHGNIEDLERSTHTKNPVPVMAWGKNKEKVLKARCIQDIPLTVEDILGEGTVT